MLYHHADKPTLLRAVHARLTASSTARLVAAATRIAASDPLESWRALARAEVRSGELALLAALAQDQALRAAEGADRRASHRERTTAAGEFATTLLATLGIAPRVDTLLLGAMLLRQLDGMVIAHVGAEADAHGGATAAHDGTLDAEIDAFALALLGLCA